MTDQRIVLHVASAVPGDDVLVGPIPDECECGHSLEHGFGLAGGGFGPYAACLACGRFYKAPIDPEDDT